MASFLFPPTRYLLSDTVIGGVVGRVAPQRSRLELGFLADSTPATNANASNSIIQQLAPLAVLSCAKTTDLSYSNVIQTSAVLDGRPKRRISASRREQCRIDQARYRRRQRERAEIINRSNDRLKEDIRNPETQRQDIKSRSPMYQSAWSVATEYFRLFQRGYMVPSLDPVPLNPASQTLASAAQQPPKAHVQLEFLSDTMAEDVTDGVVYGVEALIENWKLLSLYHSDVCVHLHRVEQVEADLLLASTTVSFTITEGTLNHLYPHLVSSLESRNEEGEATISC